MAANRLYGYVALDSGQYLIGEIWCRHERAWRILEQMTGVVKQRASFPLRLGKAIRRGYGLVTAWLEPAGEDLWTGQPLAERVRSVEQPVTMTLLTDTILVDTWGRFRQSLDEEVLQEILGSQVKRVRAFCRAGYVDGFNALLGLPRWRDLCLKAGSTVGLRFPGGTDLRSAQARLQAVEREGIGLRRHEGFGRVAFQHPVYMDGVGLKAMGFPLPKVLRGGSVEGAGVTEAVWREAEQLRQWAEGKLPQLAGVDAKEWEAASRWLHASADRSVGELLTALGRFQDPKLLTEVERQKERLETSAVEQLLRNIQQKPENLQDRLVRILADEIARRAKKSRKED